MDGVLSFWQATLLFAIACWAALAAALGLTRRVRAVMRPWVLRRVLAETPVIVRLQQKISNKHLDAFFSVLSCVVSVPFFTAFLPILAWSGLGRLVRGMTLLMALCDYLGNVAKDVVSAPRPACPPVRRVTATDDEKTNAHEYGFPSSHALFTVCLAGYLLHYAQTSCPERNSTLAAAGLFLAVLLVVLVGLARVYLGMHSFIDVAGGTALGLIILAVYLAIDDHIDQFNTLGNNVPHFWAWLSMLLLIAYPKPELPTPTFDYHTSFTGTVFGSVVGVHRTYSQFHGPDAPRIFSPELPLPAFAGRMLVGFPIVLLIKSLSKAILKSALPAFCCSIGIPVRSSGYIPRLKDGSISTDKDDGGRYDGNPQKPFDIDIVIRFLQYASLSWSVVELVPAIFSQLNL